MNLEIEERWKTFPECPTIEVSSKGHVRRKPYKVKIGNEEEIFPAELLRPMIYSGYLYVNFNNKSYSIARLVAELFVANPEGLATVIHRDGNKFHNEDSNLVWSSRSDNMKNCRNSNSYTNSSGKSIRVHCKETDSEHESIKECIKYIESKGIYINYDTFLRKFKDSEDSEVEINGLHFKRLKKEKNRYI